MVARQQPQATTSARALTFQTHVTANNALQRELTRAHQVVGPPTAMLFDATGREQRDDRLVDEFTAEQFLQRHRQQPAADSRDRS